MKKLSIYILGFVFFYGCNTNNLEDFSYEENKPVSSKKLLSVEEIQAYIKNALKENGELNWTTAPDQVIWSAAVHGGNVMSVGYTNGGQAQSKIGNSGASYKTGKETILNLVAQFETQSKSKKEQVDYEQIHSMDVTITNLETVTALKKSNAVRYLDPVGFTYELGQAESKGILGCRTSERFVPEADYSVIPPNSWMPWNYEIHNIDKAWTISTGAGITIGLIDSGISASQSLLGSAFNNGYSSGRTIEKYGTYIDSAWWWSTQTDGPDDRCGHGTSMASAIAAPRNDKGMPLGVAYNSNLISYRGASDVVLGDYHERKGVSQALIELADREDVKIISISMGFPWSIGIIKDAVQYAYRKGKMIFAAGGTSTNFTNWYGVVFPASMSEVVAITGRNVDGVSACWNCHDGSKIDFTIVMEKTNGNNADYYRSFVPVVGFRNTEEQFESGSSVATAITAGIAGLVWSNNPNMTREDVMKKLIRSSEFYPNRNNRFGYGNIDALKAVQ